jgi:hypothetical protein
MYLEEKDFISGKTWDPPKICWNEDEKHAIIAFLLLSLDRQADKDGKARLDDLFGLAGAEPEQDGEEYGEPAEKRKARDAVVRECEKFLAGLDDEERYDAIQDEIDRFIEGEDSRNLKCVIGGSYGTFGAHRNRLEGAAYRLWDLAKLVVCDADYRGNKKRLLKHLARKWGLDGSVLPALEEAAKTLARIEREERDLAESDKPFREVTALLAGLKTQEKETWQKLQKLGVHENRSESALDQSMRNMTNSTLDMVRIFNPDFEADSETDPEGESIEEEEREEPDLGEKIVDGICEGIELAGDILSAPFQWMADKLNGL